MSESQIIAVNGDGAYRFLTLREMCQHTDKFRPLPRGLLAKVRPTHYVKLCVEVLGLKHRCAEELWVRIEYRNGLKLKGTIATHPRRYAYHHIKFRQLVEFKLDQILTLRTQDLSEADLTAFLQDI